MMMWLINAVVKCYVGRELVGYVVTKYKSSQQKNQTRKKTQNKHKWFNMVLITTKTSFLHPWGEENPNKELEPYSDSGNGQLLA